MVFFKTSLLLMAIWAFVTQAEVGFPSSFIGDFMITLFAEARRHAGTEERRSGGARAEEAQDACICAPTKQSDRPLRSASNLGSSASQFALARSVGICPFWATRSGGTEAWWSDGAEEWSNGRAERMSGGCTTGDRVYRRRSRRYGMYRRHSRIYMVAWN